MLKYNSKAGKGYFKKILLWYRELKLLQEVPKFGSEGGTRSVVVMVGRGHVTTSHCVVRDSDWFLTSGNSGALSKVLGWSQMNHILFFLTRFTNGLQREFECTGRNRKYKSHKEKKWNKRSKGQEKKWKGRALPKTFFKLFNVVLLTKQEWAAKKPCFTVLVWEGKRKQTIQRFEY